MCSEGAGRKNKRETGEIFEAITTENFFKLLSGIKPQIEEVLATASRTNDTPCPQINTPVHIIFKLQKIQEEILN